MMPPLGVLLGGVDFSELALQLKAGVPAVVENGVEVAKAVDPVVIKYGLFINAIIKFVIVAFSLFMLIKAMNTLKKKEEAAPAAPPAPTKEEVLLTEIRDLLANRR
jgi:large conductance mechanosensitive channel